MSALSVVADPLPREWTLHIPGESVAKGRGRIVRMGAHMGIKTPDKTRRYEDIVRQTAIREWCRPLLVGEAIRLRATFARPIPASWSKRRQADARANATRPTGRPDLDNLCKALTDALNGVVYADDAAIVEITAAKVYGDTPGATVTVIW